MVKIIEVLVETINVFSSFEKSFYSEYNDIIEDFEYLKNAEDINYPYTEELEQILIKSIDRYDNSCKRLTRWVNKNNLNQSPEYKQIQEIMTKFSNRINYIKKYLKYR